MGEGFAGSRTAASVLWRHVQHPLLIHEETSQIRAYATQPKLSPTTLGKRP